MMFKRRIDISLTLRQKIFLGYAVMIFFTIIVGLYAIWSLNTINKITTTVIYDDVATLEKLKKLNDSILAQDLYEKRYLAFQDINADDIFWNRSSEFKSLITETEKIYPSFLNILNELATAHEKYDELFKKEVSLLKKKNIKEAENLSSTELKNYLNNVLSLLKNLEMKTG
jgi:predicted transcriptional regulator